MLYVCDYGNECIKKLPTKEQVARNSLSLIDGSINEKVISRQDFDLSEEGETLASLKNTRRNDTTFIINATESTNNREIEIDELIRKGDIFSNDVNRIRKHKEKFKTILEEGRSNRNRIDCGLEDKINLLLH